VVSLTKEFYASTDPFRRSTKTPDSPGVFHTPRALPSDLRGIAIASPSQQPAQASKAVSMSDSDREYYSSSDQSTQHHIQLEYSTGNPSPRTPKLEYAKYLPLSILPLDSDLRRWVV
jgi:hypothetical protein